jgi:hypothetical protein
MTEKNWKRRAITIDNRLRSLHVYKLKWFAYTKTGTFLIPALKPEDQVMAKRDSNIQPREQAGLHESGIITVRSYDVLKR